MRNAFVDRQLEHFRVDHDQLGVFRTRLEQDRQNHRVDTYRLTGTGGTGYQQVRHLRQVSDHRLTADIVPQGHGDWRFGFVVLRRRQHFGEAHDLPVFVGDFDTDGGLARNHFNHTHAGHCQGAGQVFGQVGDTADLDACGRLDFVTRNHRAGVNGVHRHFNAEFFQFDFQQVTDTGQGFR
ncbi:hypothetical protein D3C80_528470 [compost metagenome]